MSLGVPRWAQDQSYSASAARLQQSAQGGVGVVNPGDMVVTQGSGSQMTIAAGQANVRQSVQTEGNSFYDGIYQQDNDAPANPYNTVSAPAVNPRIDLVILRIYDVAEQGLGGSSFGRFEWVIGTESSTATLDNRSGAAALPANSLLLADVLITTGSVQTIRDRRALASPVVPPSPVSTVVAEQMIPFSTSCASVAPGSTNVQTAAACYLPRPITASRLRWSYTQGATALTGNWNVGVYDASGRLVVSTGSTAFAGAASSSQGVSAAITTMALEAGVYYVMFGYVSTNAGALTATWAHGTGTSSHLTGTNNLPLPALPNQVLGTVPASGTLLPTTFANGSLTDLWGVTATVGYYFVPVVGLSIA